MATAQCEFDGGSQDYGMETLGYSKVQTCLAPQSMVAAVTRSLRQRPHATEGRFIYGRGDRKACEVFLEYGMDDSDAVCRRY